MNNIFASMPQKITDEVFEEIVTDSNIRIERIISQGHSSPSTGWYDQEEHEWVMVLRGAGAILFEHGSEVVLRAGDYINIPAHIKHKVLWTDQQQLTVWLAVFYR